MSEINSSTISVDERKSEIVTRRIASFEEHFGEPHLFFAYHAAIAAALSPDLLYRLRLHFCLDIHGQLLNVPWEAVADVLLSGFCHEVGYELYEMDVEVRNQLLSQLKKHEKFGQERVKQLSEFIIGYVHQDLYSDDLYIRDLAEAQWLTALAQTRPRQAAHELALIFANLNHNDKSEIIRMASLLKTLGKTFADEFTALCSYAQGMAMFARGNLDSATDELGKLVEPGKNITRIVGVNLPIPKEVKDKLDVLPSKAYKNYRRTNLRGRTFKGNDLRYADFSYCDIRGANFTNANLIGANFSYTITGLRRYYVIILILFSLLLSILLASTFISFGYALHNFIFKPSSEIFLSFTFFSLIVFTLFHIIIFNKGIEATVGAIALATFGSLVLFFTLFATWAAGGWGWIIVLIFGTSGILTLIAAASSSGNGALGFMGVWSGLWIIGAGFISAVLCFIFVIAAIFATNLPPGFPDWFSGTFWFFGIFLFGLITVGITIVEALFWVIAGTIGKAWVWTIGFVGIVLWLITLLMTLFETGIEAAIAVILLAAPGAYIGWCASDGDEKYCFIWKTALFFTTIGGTSFRGANLTDANFSYARLNNADLRKANITRTNWFECKKLYQVNFSQSYLKNSQIRELLVTRMGQGKNLEGFSLRGLDLSGINLADASLISTDMRETNLQDADLSRTKLIKTHLDKADLTGSCLTGACIEDWKITQQTKLDGIECDYIYRRLSSPQNPDPARQPSDHNEIFEIGEFAEWIQNF
ncbi:pentapeptide repeat-containing protein [Nostoc sp. CHAB 5836]|uniref:pentapeptide repeat-containing protein n=1 Tax=Nostoc sp. CHAB 5836 TaxID=2780404 RepID=UPI001E436BAF|nr:pentapeptide repeat-containing protein [Nostoc sp. CHAB 5836]MCC5616278.1 pentapeptide repeat-containing protein [Nostoc sp. CHAB 5836]